MKCNQCGFEYQDQFEYCPNCGAPSPKTPPMYEPPVYAQPVSLNPSADKVLLALKDRLFLVICILMSGACALNLVTASFSVIEILITIFLWLLYADSQKGFVGSKRLRCISGCVYANYVIVNVCCGILIVFGILFGVVFEVVADTSEFIYELESVFSEYGLDELGISIADIPQELFSVMGWIIAAAFVIVAVIILVFNLLATRKIHRFTQSIYQSIMFQNPHFANVDATKNWLLVFGIFGAISAVTSLTSGLFGVIATGCIATTEIIASILIGKYFVNQPYYG